MKRQKGWKRGRNIAHIFLILLVLLLFLWLRGELKLRRVLTQENQEGLLSVEYGNGRRVPCYLADGEREDAGQAYVFLPSFADLSSLTIVSPAASVSFTDPEGQTLLADELKSISGRGNQTFRYEKMSYHVKLSQAAVRRQGPIIPSTSTWNPGQTSI